MNDLSILQNIGKVLEQQLNQVGINDLESLKKRGSKQVWVDIKSIDQSACYNRLCALEGAIRGIRWHYLDDETKKDLKDFYNTFK